METFSGLRVEGTLSADEGDVLWSARGLNPIETVEGDVLWPESGRNPLWRVRREGAFVRKRRRRFGPEGEELWSEGGEEFRSNGVSLWPGGEEAQRAGRGRNLQGSWPNGRESGRESV